MGWGCYKHEWDAESVAWKEFAEELCNKELRKPGPQTWGRDGAVCPKCYVEMEDRLALLERRERTREAWLKHWVGDGWIPEEAPKTAEEMCEMFDAIRDCRGPDGKEVG